MRCARAERMCFFAALAIAACHEDDGPYVDTDAATQSTGGDASSEGEATTGDAPWSSLDERECPEDSILTWENFGGPYVLSYCTTCHHSALPADERQRAPVGVNLETVELMRSQADRVWVRGADQNATMPPVGAPSADDRALLGEWLACGAPTQADL